jgi:hypothetical protein
MYLVLVDLLDILLNLLFYYKIIYHPMPIIKKRLIVYMIKSLILFTLGHVSSR